jgi:hypothetical protein
LLLVWVDAFRLLFAGQQAASYNHQYADVFHGIIAIARQRGVMNFV